MSLSSLSVERFRAFGRKVRLDPRPVTLVFGYNSDGKSALVRALPLLAASVGRDRPGALDLRSPAVRGASFEDLVSKYGRSLTVNFELAWDDDEQPVAALQIELRSGGIGQPEIIEALRCFDRAGAPLLDLSVDYGEDAVGGLGTYTVTVRGAACGACRPDFRGLVPWIANDWIEKVAPPMVRPELVAGLSGLQQRLLGLPDTVYWLSAVRALPPRRGELRGRPARIEADGQYADEHLAFEGGRDRTVIDEVNGFFRDVTGHELIVEESRFGGVAGYTIGLTRLGGPDFRVNILDTGEGMAQVLPVAVYLALAKCGRLGRSPIVILEHPESDLHPSAHEKVAAHLCRVAASTDVRFIVETHSENFLSRVQLAVVRGEIPVESVQLNWIWRHEDGAALRVIEIDRGAALRNWPEGVFAEDTALHRMILEARGRKVDGRSRS